MKTNEKEIIEIIAKIIRVDPNKITLDTNLFHDFGADSLLAIEILGALDKRYGVNVPEDRLNNKMKVADIIALVAEYVK
jgi:acyl carrier protein